MKREVVQDFLNLPGIMGVALMHGRLRPYFCGVDQVLNFQQKAALAQGIQQVIEATPAGFEFFEFQFNGHQVYIYKLNQGIILMVLTVDNLGYDSYTEIIDRLKTELQEDVMGTIRAFRLFAGTTPLSPKNYWQQPKAAPAVIAPTLFQPSPSHSSLQPTAPILLHDLLTALNHLSHFTTQYLGATLVVNNWKITRPDAEWLNQFEVDRTAQIAFKGSIDALTIVSDEQQQWVQAWVEAFINRCGKVMRNFSKTVRQKALNDRQKSLLLFNP